MQWSQSWLENSGKNMSGTRNRCQGCPDQVYVWGTHTSSFFICFVVLVSGIQQTELLYIYIHPLFLRLFSHIDHHRVCSRVLCAVYYSRSLLVTYFIYSSVYMSTTIFQFMYPTSFSPLLTISLLSIAVILFLFCKFIPGIYHVWYFSFSVWLNFSYYDNLQVHPCCCKWHYFILFYG